MGVEYKDEGGHGDRKCQSRTVTRLVTHWPLSFIIFMLTITSRLPPLRSLAHFSPSQINTAAQSPFQVFDRQAKRLQKDRAAARDGGNRSRTVDYVRDEVANRMIERFIVGARSEKALI